MPLENKIALFKEKLSEIKCSTEVVNTYLWYYRKVLLGDYNTFLKLPISPVNGNLPKIVDFPDNIQGKYKFYNKIAMIILNGGVGSRMSLKRPKSALTVKDGLTFVDINLMYSIKNNIFPVFMNSFFSHDQTQVALNKYRHLYSNPPRDFLQSQLPKLDQINFLPVSYPKNSVLEWCPSGHGDIFLSLYTSGLLDQLLKSGFEYAFVTPFYNLAVTIDPKLFSFFVENQYPLLIEVAKKRERDQDVTLLMETNGKLISAPLNMLNEKLDDLTTNTSNPFSLFVTGNSWINLRLIEKLLIKNKFYMDFPILLKSKRLDISNQESDMIYHIELTLSSAIGFIDGASAIEVPHNRYMAIHNIGELLLLWSDRYSLNKNYRIIPLSLSNDPIINLDTKYYNSVDDLEKRFPFGIPSLRNCLSLKIIGDFLFGARIRISGEVVLENTTNKQICIKDDSHLTGHLTF